MDALQCAREAEDRWQHTFAGERERVVMQPGGVRLSVGEFVRRLFCAIRGLLSGESLSIRECAYAI